jgi:cell division transport system permease protein
VLSWNAQLALQQVGDRREMIVYLNDDVTPSQRDVLLGRIRDLYGEPTYVTKDQAWKEFVSQVGDATLLEAVGDNPLPSSIRVQLKPELLTPDAMAATARQMQGFPEVEDVRYGAEWVRKLDALSRGLLIATIAVLAIVGVAVLLIVYTTIRFTVLARRPQVEIMARLGATGGFVAMPYVIEGVAEALIATLLALGILFGAQQALVLRAASGVAFLPPLGVVGFVAAVLLLALVSSSLALSRMLRTAGS